MHPANLGIFLLCKNLTIGSHNQAISKPINTGDITISKSLRKTSILDSFSKYIPSKITPTIIAIYKILISFLPKESISFKLEISTFSSFFLNIKSLLLSKLDHIF